jgi:hypothetical protein
MRLVLFILERTNLSEYYCFAIECSQNHTCPRVKANKNPEKYKKRQPFRAAFSTKPILD